MATMNLATLLVKLTADAKGYKKGLGDAEKDTSKFGQRMSKALDRFAVAAFAGATAAAGKFVFDSVKEYQTFEKQTAEVFTLLPDLSTEAYDAMRSDIRAFSVDTGRLTDETVPALYQAISAGVPEENVFDFLTTAHEAALGGVTDLETAVDGISSVVNAYGTDVISAAEASDLMFTAVKGGKTDFDQLSRSLFNVIPTAASLGLEFGNVTAAMATMTAQGTPTATATTQLRQLLIELSQAGTAADRALREAAGVGFAEFIEQGGNLQEALQVLEQAAADNDTSLREMFGSVEAGSAALSLTGAATDKFASELDAAATSAGATEEAAEKMGETGAQAVAELTAAFENLKLVVGEEVAPAVTDLAKGLTQDLKLKGLATDTNRAMSELRDMGLSLFEVNQIVDSGIYRLDLWRDAADFEKDIDAQENSLRRLGYAVEALNMGLEAGSDAFFDYIEVQEKVHQQLEATVYADDILTRAQYEVAEATDTTIASISEEAAILGGAFYQALNQAHTSTAELRGEMSRLADTGDEDVAPALTGVAGAADITGDEVVGLMAEMAEADLAAQAYEDAIRGAEDALGSYFQKALEGQAINDDLLEQFLQHAIQMGANTEQLRHIANATGNYTQAEVDAAIQSAGLRTEAEKLMIMFGQTGTSTEQLTTAIGLLEQGEARTAEEALNMAYVLENDVPAGMELTQESAHNTEIAIDDVTLSMSEVPAEVESTFTDNDTYDRAKAELDELQEKMDRIDGRQTSSTHTHTILTQGGASGSGGAPGASGGGQGGFQHGGYTGDGATTDVAGVVHGQEFVFSAPAVRAVGVDFMEDLHEALRVGDVNVSGSRSQQQFFGGIQLYGLQDGRSFLDELQSLQGGAQSP